MTVEFLASYNLRAEVRMKYKVVLNESEEGFSVSCPGLPGCWSQGATEEEALENIQDAITEYLAAVDDLVRGQEVREVSVAG
jgi:predicted RNase H-like HicB family nuclease